MSDLQAEIEAGATALKERRRAQLSRRKVAAPQRMAFLVALAAHGVVGKAARQAGLTVGEVYQLRERDERFAGAMDEALTETTDDIEAKLAEKALRGEQKAIETWLQANRPEKYNSRMNIDVRAAGVIEVRLFGPSGEVVEEAEVIEAEEVSGGDSA